jgi:glycosyltransferase involved in cell wall biosynthesis
MKRTLVSIIIPLYNAEKYIAQTIRSAMAQTWPDTEIIIVDDGSTDNSLAIAQTFESENIRIFRQENKGASAARNRGLLEGKGEYIQFLDADDLLSANKIEDQLNLLRTNPGYLCACAMVHFKDGERHEDIKPDDHWISEGSTNPVDFLIKLFGGNLLGDTYGGMVTVHSWLSPKNVLDMAGPWNENLTVDDDGEYFCRVILSSNGVLFSDKSFNYYRKHPGRNSLSALLTAKAYQSLLDATDYKYEFLMQAGGESELINKIFGRLYTEAAIGAYPRFKQQADYAIRRSKELKYFKPKYKSGPISNLLTTIVGWRLVRLLNYYRHGV